MPKINLTGYINATTSYGLVTLNLIKAADELGWHISTHGEMAGKCPREFAQSLEKSISNQHSFDYNAPSFRLAHQFDMAPSIGRGKRVGFTYFEMDTLTRLEQHHLNSLDHLFVPTEWAKQVCINSSVNVPITVVGSGYNDAVFKDQPFLNKEYSTNSVNRNTCIFVSLGKWGVRKQHDKIVEACNLAFQDKSSNEVVLWMGCHNQYIEGIVNNKIAAYKEILGDKLTIIGRVPHQSYIRDIFLQAFCFVAPSLAEGWNLPLLEAMACGKHCIATNYSGHTEFCDESNALLIQPTGKIPARDGMWFTGGQTNNGNWCEYSLDDLVEAMRTMYSTFEKRNMINEAGLKTAEKFTWKNTALKMQEVLNGL